MEMKKNQERTELFGKMKKGASFASFIILFLRTDVPDRLPGCPPEMPRRGKDMKVFCVFQLKKTKSMIQYI